MKSTIYYKMKSKKQAILLPLIFLTLITILPSTLAATEINDCAGLLVMNNGSDDYFLGNDIPCLTATTFGGSLWNGGLGFEPISGFIGNFDGREHKIIGLFIDRPINEVGLFAKTGGFTPENPKVIKNLVLENVNITGLSNVGAVIGRNNGHYIDNAYVSGIVNGTDNVGGVVGTNGVRITNSGSSATVTGTIYIVGGLAGFNSGYISGSNATGAVINSSVSATGGLVGWNSAFIINSYATGNVQGQDYSGGLVGYNDGGYVNFSYAEGSVGGADNVGGLIGSLYGESSAINNSHSKGTVTGTSNVGGLVGENLGIISNSYSIGNITDTGIDVGAFVGSDGGFIGTCTASFWNPTDAAPTLTNNSDCGTPSGVNPLPRRWSIPE